MADNPADYGMSPPIARVATCTLNQWALDFEGNMLARAMAIAVQHKAASILASWVINSGNLSRFTLINTEQMIEDIKKWDKIYIDMITFISTEVDITTNDCLACKDIWEMAKRGILAFS